MNISTRFAVAIHILSLRDAADIWLLDIYKAVHAVEEDALFGVHDHTNPDCPVGRNIQASIGPLFSAAQKAMENVWTGSGFTTSSTTS